MSFIPSFKLNKASFNSNELLLLAFFCLLLLGACSGLDKVSRSAERQVPCHIIYDAGSKGTRLYVYEQSPNGWIMHDGPKMAALADPVRAIRGKSMSDAAMTVDLMVVALEDMRRSGPRDKQGIAKWPAFDWRSKCSIKAVSVYGTAGMRLAEQQKPVALERLWEMLNERLSSAVGMPVTTRTLSGYEEGLFAWLAQRESLGSIDFGVSQMGGASIQVTFPCSSCTDTRSVLVEGQMMPIFSHSFLGWGQDEAWNKFGSSSACAAGVGVTHSNWQIQDCANDMSPFLSAIESVNKDINTSNRLQWYLSDAFRYMRDDDIEQYCRLGNESNYEPQKACFRAVYLRYVINTLGLPGDSETTDADWTLGAVICEATQCLEGF